MYDSILFRELKELESGFWISKNHTTVAYPEEGNARCYQIEESSFWFKHRNEMIAELVSQIKPSGVLFDIGGGNGYVSLGLQKKGIDVVLVEPGSIGARNAKQRGVPAVIHASLEDANFPAATLPAAGLFDVLEHIEDDFAFMRTVYDLLMPGGLVFLTVPAFQWLWSFEDIYAKHFRRYTLESLAATLRSAGFQVVFQTYFFSFLIPPIFITRTLPSVLGLRRSFSEEVCNKEHRGLRGIFAHLIDSLCAFELHCLRRSKSLPFGGSCLIAVQKK